MKEIKVEFWGSLNNETKLKKHIGVLQNGSVEELIKAYYRKYGIKFLNELDGGFVGYLEDGKVCYLFRDKIGIRNMYYSLCKGNIYYSTSLREVYQRLEHTEVNTQALYDFMTLLFVPGNETLYSNIFKVRAGSYVKVDNQGAVERIYYDPTKLFSKSGISNTNRELFERRIQIKLLESLSDICACSSKKIGLMLSDGVDSNLIAALLNKLRYEFCAYTITTSKGDYNDTFNSHVKRLGVRNIKKISFQNIDACILDQIAEPYPFSDIYAMSQVLKMLNNDNVVNCISGEGADELGGYSEYNRMAKLAIILDKRKHIVYENRYNGTYISSRHILGFTETEKNNFFNMPHQYESSYRVLYNVMQEIEGKTIEDMYYKFLNLDIKLRVPELLLHRIDLISQQFDVDVLFPFLSNDLIEEVLQQPRTIMIDGHNVKLAFKNILKQYTSVDDYCKRGFGETYSVELEEQTAVLYKQLLNEDLRKQPICDFIKAEAISNTIKQNDRKSWIIFSVNNWLKMYC